MPWVTCLVPTSVGKLTFQNTGTGLDLSSLKPYVQKNEEAK